MNESICPHCNKVFKVDEAGFADILKQVRDHRFEEEIQQRLAIAEKEKKSTNRDKRNLFMLDIFYKINLFLFENNHLG